MSTSVWLLFAAAVAGFAAAWLAFELRRAWSPDALRRDSSDDSELVEYVRALEGDVDRLDRDVRVLRDELNALRAETHAAEPRHEPDAPEQAPEREIYHTRPTADPERRRVEMAQLQEFLAARERRSEPR